MFESPLMLGYLQNSKVLRISGNPIKVATCEFITTAIEQLDLSSKEIEKVQLTFSAGSNTNLKALSLKDKKLTQFSMASIGHVFNGVEHNNLRELSLIGNDCINETKMDQFMALLRPSVKYLRSTERWINFYASHNHM